MSSETVRNLPRLASWPELKLSNKEKTVEVTFKKWQKNKDLGDTVFEDGKQAIIEGYIIQVDKEGQKLQNINQNIAGKCN